MELGYGPECRLITGFIFRIKRKGKGLGDRPFLKTLAGHFPGLPERDRTEQRSGRLGLGKNRGDHQYDQHQPGSHAPNLSHLYSPAAAASFNHTFVAWNKG